MSAQTSSWRSKTCTVLSFAIVTGFLVFFAYSLVEGITKQSVYTWRVGAWLGTYTLFALLATIICIALLLWMFLKRDSRWKRQAVLLVYAWVLTILIYGVWHLFGQT
jgi:Kef-type K+ transport system membrane component KefB